MNAEVLQLSFRWTHLVGGVLWIGLTYSLAWVLPRAARDDTAAHVAAWLRYGALASWVTGISLLMLLYYSGSYPYLLAEGSTPAAADWLPACAGLGVGFLVYDPAVSLGQRRGRPALAEVGPVLLLAATLVFVALLERAGFSRRAMHVHAGAFLGTSMLVNVWLRIAPALQRKSDEQARRTRHNARLSIPVLLLMISVDHPTLTGHDPWQASLTAVLALGYGLGCWLERALPNPVP